MKSVALLGNVNTEEILARRLREEGIRIDGYLLHENAALKESCSNSTMVDRTDIENGLRLRLSQSRYDVVLIGPVYMSLLVASALVAHGVPFVGATPSQIEFELDKSLLREVFPESTNIIPRQNIITKPDLQAIGAVLEAYGGNYVLKFVGDYGKKFSGSETGRTRIGGETIDSTQAVDFIRKSIEVSGKTIVQERIRGHEFSSNYVVDARGHLFRMGENICYKRRNEGDLGPVCDGTGSITINNSLPFLTHDDILFVEEHIVRPFHQFVSQRTGRPLCAILNLDLMKQPDGTIKLFEVNCREAGGHTMASILPGLATPLYDILYHAQRGTLDAIQPEYLPMVSIVVSAYPKYFPEGAGDDELMTINVTKHIPSDVRLYTGWVDLLSENTTERMLKLHNSPVLLFQHAAPTLKESRLRIYEVIQDIIGDQLDYRRDIGLNIETK